MLELIDGRAQETPVHIDRPRRVQAEDDIEQTTRQIIERVRLGGDAALRELTRELDGIRIDELQVRPEEVEKARALVRPELVDAFEVMVERLRAVCERQMPAGWSADRGDESVGELILPLRRVGTYVPGGIAAYPSSLVMTVVPAQVAGVAEVAVASPPAADGRPPPEVLAACAVLGIREVYPVGGAQAIAALAYGTESVRPVEKVVGPGNVYVNAAKRAVRGWVGTDDEAGPTEIAIITDGTVDSRVLAADLVAQAEHGPNGTHALITWVEEVVEDVDRALELELSGHARADEVENALIEGGRAVLVRDRDHAVATANLLAPEHLELACEGAHELVDRVRNAGAVFVGPWSPVSVGDYVAGTNHVLPTAGSARWSSGLGVQDFLKRIYFCGLEREAMVRLVPHVTALAEAEGLPAHARAVEVRLERAGGRR